MRKGRRFSAIIIFHNQREFVRTAMDSRGHALRFLASNGMYALAAIVARAQRDVRGRQPDTELALEMN
jgi:hypothetical protein